jgi:hypothetical protein
MPPIDDRYVRRLDDFTKALEGIVDLLKEDNSRKNVDTVNQLLTNMNEDISGIVKNMEIVVKSVKKIETQNDKILKEIQEVKKTKETGMLGNVAEVDNKRKIIDAVKIIVLIAAGVLAIGLAFKMIAPVPFLSVIAIGLAMVFIAGAFVIISAATEGMTPGDASLTSGMMVIMALGITVSSWILAAAGTLTFAKVSSILFTSIALGTSLVLLAIAVENSKLKPADYLKMMILPLVLPLIALGITISSIILASIVPLSLGQIVTTLFVAGAMGIAMYLISSSIEKTKLDMSKTGQFFAFALIAPLLSLGLVISAFILKMMPELSLKQMISSIFVAVTIGVLVYLMKPLIEKMKEFNLKEIVNTTLLIAAIAAGLVVASWILTKMSFFSIGDSIKLIFTSLAIGLAVLFLTPAVYILKSIKRDDMMQASLNIVIAAGAIAISSILLSLGMYDNVPDWRWAVGAGLAITAFAGTMWLIKKMNLSKQVMLEGALVILGVSTVIMATSWILGLGKYDKYPTFGWAAGVGLSLIAFGGAMMAIGIIMTSTGGMASAALAAGALATLGVALAISAVSWILSLGNYESYPTFKWAFGVGLTMTTFAAMMVILGIAIVGIAIGAASMMIISGTIVSVSKRLSKGDYTGGPTESWANAVSKLMNIFSWVMIKTALIPNILLSRSAEGLKIIAQNIVDISNIITQGNYFGGPDEDWAKATAALLLGFSAASMMLVNPFIFLGLSAMYGVAASIASVSRILAGGDYEKGPTLKWAKGVSMSIKAFAEGIAALQESGTIWGKLFGSNPGKKIEQIAEAMIRANELLGGVSWSDNHPTSAWAKGVGGAIMAFAKAMKTLHDADIDSGGKFVKMVVAISFGIIAAAWILDRYDWSKANNYPSATWSKGVGDAINAFAKPLALLGKYDITGRDVPKAIRGLAWSMVNAAWILSMFPWEKYANNYPSDEWSTGVGKAIGTFVKYLIEIEKNDIGRGDLRVLNRTIDAMVKTGWKLVIADTLTSGKIWDTGDKLKKWGDGVGFAVSTFVKHLVEIEKNDIGKGDLRILNKTLDAMTSTGWKLFRADLITGGRIWATGEKVEDWANNIGKAIGVFVKYLSEIENEDIGRGDLRILNRTVDSMINFAVKLGMIERAYPGIWSTNIGNWPDTVGKSLGLFVQYLVDIEKNNIKDYFKIDDLVKSMISSALKFYYIDEEFPGIWESGPKEGWVNSVGKAIGLFVDFLVNLKNNNINNFKIINGPIESMIDSALKFQELEKKYPNIWKSGPTESWANSIEKSIGAFYLASQITDLKNIDAFGDTIINFAQKLEKMLQNKTIYDKGGLFESFSESMKKLKEVLSTSNIMADGLNTLGDAFLKISSLGFTTGDAVKNLTRSVVELSDSLKNVDMENIDKLSKFSNGILVLSLLDEKKFEAALAIINKKKNDIVAILSESSGVKSKSSSGEMTVGEARESAEASEANAAAERSRIEKEKVFTQLLSTVKSLDKNVGEILDIHKDRPKDDLTKASSPEKVNT